ncbi:MAG: glycerophosphodiester phosphodiesterase family protein [Candidatus Marinimicrobia bacterium]|nr:glycerophosphodiester phosphodiesterase family protein [Candidatus Neomarinimicrobiota bacterium]
MFGLLLILFVGLILLVHFSIWKPLDTSVLYKKNPYLLFGHRGASEKEPENTIPAFKQAIIDGCNAIELDVFRTQDGHLVVFHDDTLERTTNGKGRVGDHTLIQLQTLNAAYLWPGRNEQIPTLKAVIEALPDDIVLNFEIKNNSIFFEQRTERELVRFINENGLRDRVILSSFNPLNIWRVKRSDPNIFTALIWYSPHLFSLRYFAGVHLSHPDMLHPFEENMNWCVKFWSGVKQLPLHVWVVNDAQRMKEFAADPMVKGIMSDDTQLLVETVGEELKE